MFKINVSFVVASVILCLAFRSSFGFSEETALGLKDEDAPATSEQINFLTEDDGMKEVDRDISGETTLDIKEESGHDLEDEESADMEGMS